jgi:hypothetical protein
MVEAYSEGMELRGRVVCNGLVYEHDPVELLKRALLEYVGIDNDRRSGCRITPGDWCRAFGLAGRALSNIGYDGIWNVSGGLPNRKPAEPETVICPRCRSVFDPTVLEDHLANWCEGGAE